MKLFVELGRSTAEIAEDLGIITQNLYRWKQKFYKDPDSSFPGSGKKKFEDSRDEEIHRLKRVPR